MKWLLALLTSLPLFAATGDVLNGAVLPEGWIVALRIEGGATNGTYDFGFANATNHTFNGGEKFKMTLASPGYNSSAETNVWNGTVYGTASIRCAYPDEDFPRVNLDGSDAVIYIALTDYVYAEDTGMAATIGAGLYTSSSATNNATTITLTNWSTQPYPKVLPNWRTVPHQLITSSTMRLHGMAWHKHATGGRPVAAMRFFVTDESGDVLTNTQTTMQVDFTRGEYLKSGEYVADFDLSSLTHSNLLRLDFAAYPHRGNSTTIFDTRNNLYSWPSFLPCSLTNFYYTNAYGSVAIASPLGTNATGVAYPHGTDPTTIPATDYFLDGTEAANGIETNNNTLYGHADVGGGIIYYRSGSDHPFGTTTAVGATPKAVITLKVYPGDSVQWTNDAGTDDLSDRITVDGTGGTLAISPVPTTSIPFNNVQHIHFTNCVFSNIVAASAPVSHSTQGHVYYTGNLFESWVAALPRTGAGLTSYCTMYDNNISGFNGVVIWQNTVGNYAVPTTPKSSFTWNDDTASLTFPLKEYQISYNNYLTGFTNSSPGNIGVINAITIGKAYIQNAYEATHNSASFSINGVNINATNVVWFNNVVVGARNQWFYNPSPSSTGAVKVANVIKHSIAMVIGEATDIDGPTQDGGRTNDWSMRYRVGGSGVINLMTTNTFQHSQPEFNGMRSFRPVGLNDKTPPQWAKFVLDYSYGSLVTNQAGNYRLQSRSPILDQDYQVDDVVVPFDMDGLARGRFDPPGAFAAGNFRRGGFF